MNSYAISSTIAPRTNRSRMTSLTRRALMALVAMVALSASSSALPIWIRIGLPSHECRGFGICSIKIGTPAGEEGTLADARLDGTKLTVAFAPNSSGAGEHHEILPIEAPITLDSVTAHALGAPGLTVLPGQYTIDYSSNPNGTVVLNTEPQGLIIHVDIGRRRSGCTGFGICSITIGTDASDNQVAATASRDGNKLTLDLLGATSEHGDVLTIDEPITLDSATSRALGEPSLMILPGRYTVNYSSNPNGTVVIDTRPSAFVVEVKFGRASRGCRGFGICSIKIGFDATDAADRQIPTIPTVNGDKLTLEMLAPAPEQGNALVIDQDIVLDAATSQALGLPPSKIVRGSYIVDYSSNPNGTVQVQLARIGITIGIDVGRKSKDCTGFGICSITIGIDIALRTPAAASIHGSKLALELLAPTREHGDTLVIDEDIMLDEATSQALGLHRMKVLRGAYPVDYSSNPNGSVEVAMIGVGVGVTIDVGRKSKGCTGFGICKITVDIDLDFSALRVPAIATLEGSSLTLELQKRPDGNENVMVIDEDIILDSATSRALGSRGVKIMAGAYQVDYSKNPNGTIHLNARPSGIVIEIKTGRASRNCTGFGICSITIGFGSSANQDARAIASLSGHTLSLQFITPLAEREDMMMIDDDITLDSVAARLLGSHGLVVKKGAYPVRYDAAGMASVDLEVTTRGFGVTIYIGRPFRNCTGLGFCGIVIDFTSTERGVHAIATPGRNSLDLDLIDASPERDSVLHLDAAVELDSTAAAAFGATMIVPGEYPVDYSENPNGTVHLFTRTNGASGVTEDAAIALRATAQPNPTSGATTIAFSLAHAGSVSATLSDATGREVMMLLDGKMMEAGARSIGFNASTLPNGIYFYTIRTSAGMQTGSVVVAR
jgi:hypothetical protein